MPSRRAFERKGVASRNVGSKLLVVCEGKATEYGYFEAARMDLRLPKGLVQVVHPNATDPSSLVQAAIDSTLKQEWKSGDQAWAVFDGDEHRDRDPDNWNHALQLAHGIVDKLPKRVHLAVSNPCFELWYLLHFQEQNANLHRDVARRVLRRYLPDYEKSDILWQNLTEQQRIEACKRAEALAARISREERDSFDNPSAGIYVLVKTLLSMKRD